MMNNAGVITMRYYMCLVGSCQCRLFCLRVLWNWCTDTVVVYSKSCFLRIGVMTTLVSLSWLFMFHKQMID